MPYIVIYSITNKEIKFVYDPGVRPTYFTNSALLSHLYPSMSIEIMQTTKCINKSPGGTEREELQPSICFKFYRHKGPVRFPPTHFSDLGNFSPTVLGPTWK